MSSFCDYSDELVVLVGFTGIVKAGAGVGGRSLDIITEGGFLTYLSVTGKLLLSLLLVVFGIGVFSSPDSGIIDFDSRVPVRHHHASLR